jgi:hypothetical protein
MDRGCSNRLSFKRILKKQQASRLLFFPMFAMGHWSLAVAVRDCRRIFVFDSLRAGLWAPDDEVVGVEGTGCFA